MTELENPTRCDCGELSSLFNLYTKFNDDRL